MGLLQKKVFVGMSGGVDSSVATLLLKEQGYNVVGVFIRSWDGLPTKGGVKFRDQCHWKEDRRDAMRVAAKLGIPFLTYDFTEAYREEVIEYFFREYASGRTPNPDVVCNREIKFKRFLERALAEGADFVATGHYARIGAVSHKPYAISNVGDRATSFELLQARDANKDQSYFLYTLGQHELAHTLFPIGDYVKSEVRELARQAGLPTADKPDSQGICFVGKVPVVEFLKARLPEQPGAVVTVDGRVVGEHHGLPFYTIGQRHGLRLSASLPYYVARKDHLLNTITVGQGNSDEALYRSDVCVGEVTWVNRRPVVGERLQAKIRYRQPSQKVTVDKSAVRESATSSVTDNYSPIRTNKGIVWMFHFDKPQRAVTPGQSLVLYDGERVVGGGVIK